MRIINIFLKIGGNRDVSKTNIGKMVKADKIR